VKSETSNIGRAYGYMKDNKMPKLSVINSLKRRWKRSVPSNILKTGSVFNLREGEEMVVTYTSAADKMSFFSAFVRNGLENGDTVWYTYPDAEKETIRTKLRERGIDVEKHERKGSLILDSLTEHFMPNGKLDYEQAVITSLDWWAEAKSRGYKHARSLEDLGDFFLDRQWQKYVTVYWHDPRWDDPDVSEWVEAKEPVGLVMDPFIMEITAFNVERMREAEVIDILRALGEGEVAPARLIDLLEDASLFSKSMGLDHEGLTGRKILMEFDPVSDYEKVVHDLAKETMANVEPIFVFTSKTSSIHSRLAKDPAIKFFLTSISTSVPESTSENTVLLPANNMPLILDAINKALEAYGEANVCFVFDILSELLTSMGREKTYLFLHHALDMLSSEKVTALFLFNPSAHEPQVVSSLRNLFGNQLVYGKNGLEATKTS